MVTVTGTMVTVQDTMVTIEYVWGDTVGRYGAVVSHSLLSVLLLFLLIAMGAVLLLFLLIECQLLYPLGSIIA